MSTTGIRAAAVNSVGHIAQHTDTLNKFIKTAEQAVNLVKVVVGNFVPGGEGVAAGLGLLGGQLKTAKSVINATNIFERGYNWGLKSQRDQLMRDWRGTAKMVTLTVAQFFETTLFIDKSTGGFLMSFVVCRLPFFEIVKNGLYLASASFSLWQGGSKLSETRHHVAETKRKQTKWENISTEDGEKRSDYQEKWENGRDTQNAKSERREEEIARYEDKINQRENEKEDALDKKEAARLEAKLNKTRQKLEKAQSAQEKAAKKIAKYQEYLTEINKEPEGDDPRNGFEKIKDHKIKQYNIRLSNDKKSTGKLALGIAVDVGKIVMITLGMLVAALAVTFPVLTLPTSIIVITALSLTSNALGLTKNIYRMLEEKEIITKEKEQVFAASAA